MWICPVKFHIQVDHEKTKVLIEDLLHEHVVISLLLFYLQNVGSFTQTFIDRFKI